jgi:hypothetical protein
MFGEPPVLHANEISVGQFGLSAASIHHKAAGYLTVVGCWNFTGSDMDQCPTEIIAGFIENHRIALKIAAVKRSFGPCLREL